jgi:alpha-galactosidase
MGKQSIEGRQLKILKVLLFPITLFSITLVQCRGLEESVKLKNDEFCLELEINNHGIPFIKNGYWRDNDQVAFYAIDSNTTLQDWLPQDLFSSDIVKKSLSETVWQIEKSIEFSKATAEMTIDQLKVTWVVELPNFGSLFRMYVLLSNNGNKDIPIDWFPIWSSSLNLSSENIKTLSYWHPLTYQPKTDSLKKDYTKTLYSNVYSSDSHGEDSFLPYWRIEDKINSLSYSLSWSGGWEAEISANQDSIGIRVKLPSEETQLKLLPGETIEGPIMNVFADHHTNTIDWRKNWLTQRERLSNKLFKKPENWQPLIYNHWYAVRFNLSSDFINKQLEAMDPYNFDVFVVDAGWYNGVGDWTPNQRLFKKGEFENAMQQVKQNGIDVGIWSCPWLIAENGNNPSNETKELGYYNKFMKSYAMELADDNFSSKLNKHVQILDDQFQINWWKYDQELFGDYTKNGKMKNVIALQKSLATVRQSFPELNIENCMSGGRMINEFTDQIAQSHWIRDGRKTGFVHAQSNIQEALGAIQFLSPLKVQRWTNRINEIDEDNSELLKMYCRSAMIGVWGVSTDLNKITDKQKKVILSEIENYRALAPLKESLTYDILYPDTNSDVAGVIFYDQSKENAAALLFRWDQKESITNNVKLDIMENAEYKVLNIDTKEEKIYLGENSSNGTFKMTMKEGQFSSLFFMSVVK